MNLPGDSRSGGVTPEPDEPETAAGAEAGPDRAAETGPDRAAETGPDRAVETGRAARQRAVRHRLAESIAEGLLPETTGDERHWGDGEQGYSAAWYAENRPPHHDR
ncbi:hypothetical protein [Nakamurella lactea]|uniref:hypothetical protein n=1 Tax=Nakamurella lactea TaxID=459515 RepID=UPI0012B50678|nr:hypothetical protein [Nakamurella lactea]